MSTGGLIKYNDGLLSRDGELATSLECCCLVCDYYDWAFSVNLGGFASRGGANAVADAIWSYVNAADLGYRRTVVWNCLGINPDGFAEEAEVFVIFICCLPQGSPQPPETDPPTARCDDRPVQENFEDFITNAFPNYNFSNLGPTGVSTEEGIDDTIALSCGSAPAPLIPEIDVRHRVPIEDCCENLASPYITDGYVQQGYFQDPPL